MNDWRDLGSFPQRGATDGWLGRRSKGRDIIGKAAVDHAIKRWHPFDTLLVASPDSHHLLPVLNIAALKTAVHHGLKRRVRLNLLILLVCAALLWLLNHFRHMPRAGQSLSALIAIALFILLDYRLVISKLDALGERTLFYLQLRRTARIDILLWGGVMLAAGAMQCALQYRIGLDAMIARWGAMYASISAGQWWRLLTGPFIHADVWHWTFNLLSLCFAGCIAGAISRRQTVTIFLLACVASALATWALSASTHNEAMVGVSGGIYGVFGFCIGQAWRQPRLLPRHMGWTILSFSLLNFYLAQVLTSDVSLTAHAAGLGVGIAYGLLLPARPGPAAQGPRS